MELTNFQMFAAFGATTLLLLVISIFVCRRYLFPRYRTAESYAGGRPVTIGFFHPYCNAGGGGERVLWYAIQALQGLHRHPVPLHVLIYTGDLDASPEQILKKAESRFGLRLSGDLKVDFLYLKRRDLLEATRYPRFTLLGQSLGSVLLTWEALRLGSPDIFIDSTGFAFSFPLARFLAGSIVATYVHYPTISTDMLQRVRERRPSYNNQSSVTSSSSLSLLKLIYYHFFAFLYGLMGRCADLVMVNSTWTLNHILQLWGGSSRAQIVYPPCSVEEFEKLPLEGRQREIVSIGQFRPEKDHNLQLEAFHKLTKTKDTNNRYRLSLIGGCRNAEDEKRVKELRQKARQLGIEEEVVFSLNVPFEEILSSLSRSSVGLHTMWNEHFGICVVEMMAAGLVTIAHNSGGPASDIVKPLSEASNAGDRDGKIETGFLASTAEEYADRMLDAFQDRSRADRIRRAAREQARKFSNQNFMEGFQRAMTPVIVTAARRQARYA